MSIQSPGDSTFRFSPITNDDYAGYIWIVTILGLIYSSCGGLIRVCIKWGTYGVEDYLLGVATIVLFGQSSAIIYGLNKGLAKSNTFTPEIQWALSGKSFFASEILCILILCLSKCSVVSLIFRVFTIDLDKTWLICLGTLFLSILWGVVSMIGLAINCDHSTILTTKNVSQCPDQFFRWQAITAVDIITEICICSLPIAFVWPTRMPIWIKVQVFLAFAFRLPLILLSAIHLQLFNHYPGSPQPQFAISASLILQQVMLTYSLLSATIPNLRSFMRSFSVGMGVSLGFIHGDLSDKNNKNNDNNSSSNTYHHPQSLEDHANSTTGKRNKDNKNRRRTMRLVDDSPQLTTVVDHNNRAEGYELQPILRADTFHHEVTIQGSSNGKSGCRNSSSGAEDVRAVSRSGSQDMMITKEMEWRVYHEPSS